MHPSMATMRRIESIEFGTISLFAGEISFQNFIDAILKCE